MGKRLDFFFFNHMDPEMVLNNLEKEDMTESISVFQG